MNRQNLPAIAAMMIPSFFGILFYWVHHPDQEPLPVLLLDVIASYFTEKIGLPACVIH